MNDELIKQLNPRAICFLFSRILILLAWTHYFVPLFNLNRVKAFSVPKPTKSQAKWLDFEVGAVVHFDMQTFSRFMGPDNVELPDTFNPKHLSTDQWVKAARSFGAKYIIFTIDHFSGFLMWPSETNYNYSVKFTKWRNGKGNIVRDFMKSSKKYGLEHGFFYSVHNNWYMGVNNYSTGDCVTQQRYNEIVEEQMRELFNLNSMYKNPFYIWFDAGIVPNVSPNVGPIIRSLAKNSLCDECPTFAGNQGLRWVGNEQAVATLPHWYSVPKGKCSMKTDDGKVIQGNPYGDLFCPANCDTVIREHYWFWEPDTEHTIKSVHTLVDQYLTSVGHGCTLLLNINPDTRGLVPAKDLKVYKKFGKAIKLLYKEPVVTIHRPKFCIGCRRVWIFKSSRKLRVGSVVLMEDIEKYGQLVMEYELKFKTSHGWIRSSNESTIGHKRIHQFSISLDLKEVRGISLKITKLVTKKKYITLRQVAVYDWTKASKKNLIQTNVNLNYVYSVL